MPGPGPGRPRPCRSLRPAPWQRHAPRPPPPPGRLQGLTSSLGGFSGVFPKRPMAAAAPRRPAPPGSGSGSGSCSRSPSRSLPPSGAGDPHCACGAGHSRPRPLITHAHAAARTVHAPPVREGLGMPKQSHPAPSPRPWAGPSTVVGRSHASHGPAPLHTAPRSPSPPAPCGKGSVETVRGFGRGPYTARAPSPTVGRWHGKGGRQEFRMGRCT